MAQQKIANNAYGVLAASITTSATTLTLSAGQGSRFPSISGGDWAWATLTDAANNLEIVKVTGRAVDTFTIVRAQDNTTAKAYASGDRFDLRPCAATMNDKLDVTVAAATYVTIVDNTAALSDKLSTSTASTTYVKLAGGNTVSGVQKIQAQHGKVSTLGSVSGAISIDLATAQTFSMTISGNTSISFLNPPTGGYDVTFYLKMTNGGAWTVSFPAGYQTPGGLPLGLTAVGKDLLAVWYDNDSGLYVVAPVFKDFK